MAETNIDALLQEADSVLAAPPQNVDALLQEADSVLGAKRTAAAPEQDIDALLAEADATLAPPAVEPSAQATELRNRMAATAGIEQAPEPQPQEQPLPTGALFTAKEGLKNIGRDIAAAPGALAGGLARGAREAVASAGDIAARAVETRGFTPSIPGTSAIPSVARLTMPATNVLEGIAIVERGLTEMSPRIQGFKKKAVREIREWAQGWRSQNEADKLEWAENPLAKAASVIGEAAPLFGTAIAASVATKSPVPAAILFGSVEGAGTYEAARGAGKGIKYSNVVANLNQTWNMVSEGIPFDAMLKNAGKRAIQRFVKGAITEGTQELVQTVGTNVIEKAGFDRGRNIMEGWLEAIVGGVGLGGAGGVAIRGGGAGTDVATQAQEQGGERTWIDKAIELIEGGAEDAGGVAQKQAVVEERAAPEVSTEAVAEKAKVEPPPIPEQAQKTSYTQEELDRSGVSAEDASRINETIEETEARIRQQPTTVTPEIAAAAEKAGVDPVDLQVDDDLMRERARLNRIAQQLNNQRIRLNREAFEERRGLETQGQDVAKEGEAVRETKQRADGQTVVPPPSDTGGEVYDKDRRRFSQRVANLRPETREGISALDMQIDHLSDADAISEAQARIDADEQAVIDALGDPRAALDPINFTAAQLLIDKAIRDGNIDKAIDIIDKFAPATTKAAQSLQKLTLFSKLTPAGMLRYATRQMQKISRESGKEITLSREEQQNIVRYMEEAQKAAERGDAREHDKNIARAMAVQADKIPSSFWRKVGMVQTLAQLLNVKTIGRNVVGNSIFAGLDNVSKTMAAVVDYLASKATGERTTSAPNVKRQLRGWKQGFLQAVEEISEGIDTQPEMQTKFDIPRGRTFANKYLGALEKILGYALRAPDRAAYTAEFNDSLARQMKAKGVDAPTQAMIDNAIYDGLYVTFQDNSLAAQSFSKLKKILNAGKEFGIGDFVLKYPKTPANLLQRGIDYSPAGLARGIMDFARPLFGKPLNQYRASLNLSRGITGTAIMMAGYALARLGIVSGTGERDRDVEALEREQGRGRYRVNASALKRFVLSGFSSDVVKPVEGDVYVTYDWAQPTAFSVGGGATLGEATVRGRVTQGDMLGMILDATSEASRTLTEQPLLTGVQRLAKGKDLKDVLTNIIVDAPSSFIPTLMGQMAYYSDANIKDPKDRRVFNEMMKRAAKKIPVLNRYVPNRVGTTGETVKIKNPTLFNLFINPAIVTKYEPSPGSELVIDIFERGLGEQKRQFPRHASNTITIQGHSINLTTEERNRLQELMGKETMSRLDRLAQEQWPWKSSPERVAKHIDNNILTPISRMARNQLIQELGGINALVARSEQEGKR